MSPQKLQFSKGEAIRFGWNAARSNIKFFIILFLIYVLIAFCVGLIKGLLLPLNATIVNIIFTLIGWAVNFIITLISYKIWLKFAENKKPSYSEIFSVLNLLPKFTAAFVLYIIAIFGGFILILVPAMIFIGASSFISILFKEPVFIILGLIFSLILLTLLSTYFALKYQFFGYFIVALGKDVGPMESLKLSSKITSGVKRNLYLFWILSGLITFLGALAFLVGLVLAVPTTGIAHAYIFKKLVSQIQPAPVS